MGRRKCLFVIVSRFLTQPLLTCRLRKRLLVIAGVREYRILTRPLLIKP